MTDFQVGDRVSVEGVVLDKGYPLAGEPGSVTIAVAYQTLQVPHAALTLVERPKRKLRVGSVWECQDAEMPMVRYTVVAPDMFVFTHQHGPTFMRRDITSIDTHPQSWREVPVEELEREAEK